MMPHGSQLSVTLKEKDPFQHHFLEDTASTFPLYFPKVKEECAISGFGAISTTGFVFVSIQDRHPSNIEALIDLHPLYTFCLIIPSLVTEGQWGSSSNCLHKLVLSPDKEN